MTFWTFDEVLRPQILSMSSSPGCSRSMQNVPQRAHGGFPLNLNEKRSDDERTRLSLRKVSRRVHDLPKNHP